MKRSAMLQNENLKNPQKERRSHERVQDAIGLQIERLHEMPAAGEPASRPSTDTNIRRANKYDIPGYADVKRDYPAVASYVQELEERIRQLQLDGVKPAEAPTHKVSLSASGVAFADDQLLYPGELVGITLTLFPSLRRIGCDARVVSTGDAPEIANGEKHTYRMTFVRITDEDRAMINEHVKGLRKSIPKDAP